jgi:hypothetical protein
MLEMASSETIFCSCLHSAEVLVVVKPETVIGWRWAGFGLCWRRN